MADHLNDSTLLERFVTLGEDAAFTVLMRRHVPVVRAACRRVLRSEHDAEDVVQATFLVLALKAAEVNWRESVGGWLCAVAHRLALDAREGLCRRNRRETPWAAFAGDDRGWSGEPFPETFHPAGDPTAEVDRRDLRRVLDDELNRLPDHYRAPVQLCDLEGLTHAEAARRLGVPSGSISRRLSRARALLRHRLAGRGLPMAVLVLVCVLIGLRFEYRQKATIEVRQAMAVFNRPEGSGLDLERFLSRIREDEPSAETRTEAARIALHATEVSERIGDLDPGRDRLTWRTYAGDLHRSAIALAQASRDGDGQALVSAARRANESCVQCHLTFRQ